MLYQFVMEQDFILLIQLKYGREPRVIAESLKYAPFQVE